MENLPTTISTFELSRLMEINHKEVMKICEAQSEAWGFINKKSAMFDRAGGLVIIHHLNKDESIYLMGLLSPHHIPHFIKMWNTIEEIVKNNMVTENVVKKITSFELSKLTGIDHDELLNIAECELEDYEVSNLSPKEFKVTTMVKFEKIQSISFIIRVSPEYLDDLIEWWNVNGD